MTGWQLELVRPLLYVFLFALLTRRESLNKKTVWQV